MEVTISLAYYVYNTPTAPLLPSLLFSSALVRYNSLFYLEEQLSFRRTYLLDIYYRAIKQHMLKNG